MSIQVPLREYTHIYTCPHADAHTQMLTLMHIHRHIPLKYTHIHTHTSQTFSYVCNTKTHTHKLIHLHRHAHTNVHTVIHSSHCTHTHHSIPSSKDPEPSPLDSRDIECLGKAWKPTGNLFPLPWATLELLCYIPIPATEFLGLWPIP